MINTNLNAYLRFHGAIVKDPVYQDTDIEEWNDNPLLTAFPPRLLGDEAISSFLAVPPQYKESDRDKHKDVRIDLLPRIRRFLVPHGVKHLDLFRKVRTMINSSYELRNPISPTYAHYLGATSHEPVVPFVWDPPSGQCLFGISGSGKTLAMQRCLSFFPQLIVHNGYFKEHPMSCSQLVWLKLDCPPNARIKGLAINYFRSIDSLYASAGININTLKEYGFYGKANDNVLIDNVIQVAKLVNLGLLVIDETQLLYALMHNRNGELVKELIGHLVHLENGIGSPIMFMGTPLAKEVLSDSLVMARRASLLGDVEFECLLEGTDDCDTFVNVLCSLEYTTQDSPIDALKHDLLDQSQGNPAIAVSIWMGAQYRAISSGTEKVTPQMIKAVIKEDYPRLIKPLEKLRKSKNKRFETNEDYERYEEAYRNEMSKQEIMDYKELGLKVPRSGSPKGTKGNNSSRLPLKGAKK